ncbi:hypothetical protein GCM10010387_10970 [Streptomyces inusitatus]|uniref:Uncharacterized protein n=1 Tax=Streptomyces inusitatus TaxID=68221 RepID=A0A918PR14_9ACTN|nr:hypothetical protein [Streptomyces inusitatus]GGZ19844.1 hypothetical protein GCM10010387_10970 [Streptomyces inusitatus]
MKISSAGATEVAVPVVVRDLTPAERAAYSRPESWGDDEAWSSTASAAMTSLWIAERHLALLCDEALHAPVHAYGRALNQAVWREIGDIEVNEHLEEHKAAFMAAARANLASSGLVSTIGS